VDRAEKTPIIKAFAMMMSVLALLFLIYPRAHTHTAECVAEKTFRFLYIYISHCVS
jgi:hypothetical protein